MSYSAAISSCEKGMQWSKALELLATMEKRGVVPDVICYSAVNLALDISGIHLDSFSVAFRREVFDPCCALFF